MHSSDQSPSKTHWLFRPLKYVVENSRPHFHGLLLIFLGWFIYVVLAGAFNALNHFVPGDYRSISIGGLKTLAAVALLGELVRSQVKHAMGGEAESLHPVSLFIAGCAVGAAYMLMLEFTQGGKSQTEFISVSVVFGFVYIVLALALKWDMRKRKQRKENNSDRST